MKTSKVMAVLVCPLLAALRASSVTGLGWMERMQARD